ncbi:MAG: hypothetical protein VZR33_02585 [Methanosphaera sp.]|nr:hypothetical protein [Methanosphaera sp.]
MKKIEEVNFKSIELTIANMDNDKKELCTSLLYEIKFMYDTLNELKTKVSEMGVITKMCQGKYDIERANPALNQYNTLVKNYSSCIKQLNELLPKEESNLDDEFDNDEL